MKSVYGIIGGLLTIGIVLLIYFGLFVDISDEIELRKVMDIRKSENIQNLKDLRQVQLQYKKDKGYYANHADTLLEYLLNGKVEFINREKADNDSIPSNMRKWKNIQRNFIRSIRQKINPSAIAKEMYKESGGKWKTLTTKEKIKKGYIAVDTFIAYELSFTTDYMKSRSNIYQIDFNNLSNIKNIYKNITSNAFSTEFANHQESTLSKIEIESTYSKITSNYNYIFDGDPNTSISVKELKHIVEDHTSAITSLKTSIETKENSIEEAQQNINFIIDKRNAYTKEIGEEKILKIKEKAKKKEEKGKKLKGRNGIVYGIILEQDSTEEANKDIIRQCNKDIEVCNDEIKARSKMIAAINRNIQCLQDINVMQSQFKERKNIESKDFGTLASFTLNEIIEITTVLKKGKYKIPTMPEEWEKAQIQAELLVEKSLGEDILNKIDKKYQDSGGKFRGLTDSEAYARGLITVIIKSVKEVVFNEIYLKGRSTPDIQKLIYIPYTKIKYKFATKKTQPTEEERMQGERDKYFFQISADYDDVFSGLDEENVLLRTNREKKDIRVGSLEKTITNGNWGE